MATPYPVKHTLTKWPSNPIPGYFPRENKNLYSQKHVLKYFNDFICNNQKLEITQMFVNKRMNKQTVTYSYNGILINSQTEKTH